MLQLWKISKLPIFFTIFVRIRLRFYYYAYFKFSSSFLVVEAKNKKTILCETFHIEAG